MHPTAAEPAAAGAISAFDWLSLGVGIFGVLLTFVGFWLAIVQIRRTKTAAQAAFSAVRTGTARIRYNQLLIVAPQLQTLESELDAAINENDHFSAERVLLRWRQLATTAHGLLVTMAPDYSPLVEAIEATREGAIVAKGRLSESSSKRDGRSVISIVASTRKEISKVNDDLGSVVGRLASEIPPEEVEK